jgi:hypothetical protein
MHAQQLLRALRDLNAGPPNSDGGWLFHKARPATACSFGAESYGTPPKEMGTDFLDRVARVAKKRKNSFLRQYEAASPLRDFRRRDRC